MPFTKKARTSADFDKDPKSCGRPVDEQLFIEAKRHFDRVTKHHHLALLNAQECGAYLCRAKKFWKRRSENRWLKKLRQVFTARCVRTVQDYMRIAEEWGKIEPLVPEHPNLSIAGALRFLRTGKISKRKSWDNVRFEKDKQWAELNRMWADWPEEAKGWLRDRPDLVEDLLINLVKENVEPKRWRRYVSPKLRDRVDYQAFLADRKGRLEERTRLFRFLLKERFKGIEPLITLPKKYVSRKKRKKKRLSGVNQRETRHLILGY